MKNWKALGAGLALLVALSPRLAAQVPGGVTPPPQAAQAMTLWSFLGISCDQIEAMKAKCCKKPLGQLISQMKRPINVATGGVLCGCCEAIVPSAADQAQPGVLGLCAKVKADAAGVKARRAAVRCLSEVDCRRMPDVAEALVATMRTDLSECVRYDAAVALGEGCCCTKKVIESLAIVATGSGKDNLPPEKCERVRFAALASLQHCLCCYKEEAPAPEPKKEAPEPPGKTAPENPGADNKDAVKQMAYYQKLEARPAAEIVQEAHRVLRERTQPSPTVMPTGSRSLFGIVSHSINPHIGVLPQPVKVDVDATGTGVVPVETNPVEAQQPVGETPVLQPVPVKVPMTGSQGN